MKQTQVYTKHKDLCDDVQGHMGFVDGYDTRVAKALEAIAETKNVKDKVVLILTLDQLLNPEQEAVSMDLLEAVLGEHELLEIVKDKGDLSSVLQELEAQDSQKQLVKKTDDEDVLLLKETLVETLANEIKNKYPDGDEKPDGVRTMLEALAEKTELDKPLNTYKNLPIEEAYKNAELRQTQLCEDVVNAGIRQYAAEAIREFEGAPSGEKNRVRLFTFLERKGVLKDGVDQEYFDEALSLINGMGRAEVIAQIDRQIAPEIISFNPVIKTAEELETAEDLAKYREDVAGYDEAIREVQGRARRLARKARSALLPSAPEEMNVAGSKDLAQQEFNKVLAYYLNVIEEAESKGLHAEVLEGDELGEIPNKPKRPMIEAFNQLGKEYLATVKEKKRPKIKIVESGIKRQATAEGKVDRRHGGDMTQIVDINRICVLTDVDTMMHLKRDLLVSHNSADKGMKLKASGFIDNKMGIGINEPSGKKSYVAEVMFMTRKQHLAYAVSSKVYQIMRMLHSEHGFSEGVAESMLKTSSLLAIFKREFSHHANKARSKMERQGIDNRPVDDPKFDTVSDLHDRHKELMVVHQYAHTKWLRSDDMALRGLYSMLNEELIVKAEGFDDKEGSFIPEDLLVATAPSDARRKEITTLLAMNNDMIFPEKTAGKGR